MKLFEFVQHLGEWRVLIQARDIRDGSVTTDKIADGAITTRKIADGSVTTDKIADGSVTGNNIADRAITADKIAEGTVDRLLGLINELEAAFYKNIVWLEMDDKTGDIWAYYGEDGNIVDVRMDEAGNVFVYTSHPVTSAPEGTPPHTEYVTAGTPYDGMDYRDITVGSPIGGQVNEGS